MLCEYKQSGDRWKCENCGRQTPPLPQPPRRNCTAAKRHDGATIAQPTECLYRGSSKVIPRNMLDCGCTGATLFECGKFDELVTFRNFRGDEETLKQIEPRYKGETCRGCDAMADNRFWRYTDLVNDALTIADRLPSTISMVAGVPRSGMIAAAAIATRLGLPLAAINGGRLDMMAFGLRLHNQLQFSADLLVVEDSVNTGRSIKDATRNFPNAKTAAIYVRPEQSELVDFIGRKLPMPHFFEWHYFGSDLVKNAAFDLDGVISEECPSLDDDDGERYSQWLKNVKPLWLPKPHPVGAIVTARLEKYREPTEQWLQRHGVQYSQLRMGPWSSKLERSKHFNAGEYKGGALKKNGLQTFLESCPIQSRQIHEATGKTVVCPTSGDIWQ